MTQLDQFVVQSLADKMSLTSMICQLRLRATELARQQTGNYSQAARILGMHRNTLDRIRKGNQKRGW